MPCGVPIPASGTRCGVSDVGAPPISKRLLGPSLDWRSILREAGIPEPEGREECLRQIARDRALRESKERADRRQKEQALMAKLARQAKRNTRGTNRAK